MSLLQRDFSRMTGFATLTVALLVTAIDADAQPRARLQADTVEAATDIEKREAERRREAVLRAENNRNNTEAIQRVVEKNQQLAIKELQALRVERSALNCVVETPINPLGGLPLGRMVRVGLYRQPIPVRKLIPPLPFGSETRIGHVRSVSFEGGEGPSARALASRFNVTRVFGASPLARELFGLDESLRPVINGDFVGVIKRTCVREVFTKDGFSMGIREAGPMKMMSGPPVGFADLMDHVPADQVSFRIDGSPTDGTLRVAWKNSLYENVGDDTTANVDQGRFRQRGSIPLACQPNDPIFNRPFTREVTLSADDPSVRAAYLDVLGIELLGGDGKVLDSGIDYLLVKGRRLPAPRVKLRVKDRDRGTELLIDPPAGSIDVANVRAGAVQFLLASNEGDAKLEARYVGGVQASVLRVTIKQPAGTESITRDFPVRLSQLKLEVSPAIDGFRDARGFARTSLTPGVDYELTAKAIGTAKLDGVEFAWEESRRRDSNLLSFEPAKQGFKLDGAVSIARSTMRVTDPQNSNTERETTASLRAWLLGRVVNFVGDRSGSFSGRVTGGSAIVSGVLRQRFEVGPPVIESVAIRLRRGRGPLQGAAGELVPVFFPSAGDNQTRARLHSGLSAVADIRFVNGRELKLPIGGRFKAPWLKTSGSNPRLVRADQGRILPSGNGFGVFRLAAKGSAGVAEGMGLRLAGDGLLAEPASISVNHLLARRFSDGDNSILRVEVEGPQPMVGFTARFRTDAGSDSVSFSEQDGRWSAETALAGRDMEIHVVDASNQVAAVLAPGRFTAVTIDAFIKLLTPDFVNQGVTQPVVAVIRDLPANASKRVFCRWTVRHVQFADKSALPGLFDSDITPVEMLNSTMGHCENRFTPSQFREFVGQKLPLKVELVMREFGDRL